MDKEPHKAASPDPDRDSTTAGMRPTEPVPVPVPASMNPALDPRHRRGSLGPAPMAAALDDSASPTALHAHLVSLLDHRRPAPDMRPDMPPDMPPDASGPDMRMAMRPDMSGDQLGPHEDLDRLPDGIPHLVIGLTALFAVALAAALIWMFQSTPTLGGIAAAVIGLIALPVLVFKLGAKAERDRDHDHPSR
jgi:hypothetical protein